MIIRLHYKLPRQLVTRLQLSHLLSFPSVSVDVLSEGGEIILETGTGLKLGGKSLTCNLVLCHRRLKVAMFIDISSAVKTVGLSNTSAEDPEVLCWQVFPFAGFELLFCCRETSRGPSPRAPGSAVLRKASLFNRVWLLKMPLRNIPSAGLSSAGFGLLNSISVVSRCGQGYRVPLGTHP